MDGNFRPKLTSFGLNKGLEILERQPPCPAADLTARSWFVLFCQVTPKYKNTEIQVNANPRNWFILFCRSKIHPTSGREVMVARE